MLINVVKQHTPKKVKIHNHLDWNPVKWDEKCNKQIRLTKAAFKKWQHTGLIEDWINYRKHISPQPKRSLGKVKILKKK